MPEEPIPDADQPKLDELISLSEGSEFSGLTQPHLALLIRQGKLWGRKIARNWLTTRRAIEKYLSQERKPGPKSKKNPKKH